MDKFELISKEELRHRTYDRLMPTYVNMQKALNEDHDDESEFWKKKAMYWSQEYMQAYYEAAEYLRDYYNKNYHKRMTNMLSTLRAQQKYIDELKEKYEL